MCRLVTGQRGRMIEACPATEAQIIIKDLIISSLTMECWQSGLEQETLHTPSR